MNELHTFKPHAVGCVNMCCHGYSHVGSCVAMVTAMLVVVLSWSQPCWELCCHGHSHVESCVVMVTAMLRVVLPWSQPCW